MQHTLVIDDESIDILIVSELKSQYENFGVKPGVPRVSYNPDEEAAYVRKMRKALKRVIQFYGGEV